MIVIGVDPGPTQSAFVVWDGRRVTRKGIVPNAELRQWLSVNCRLVPKAVVFEQVESFGMAVGRDVFETVLQTGRMFQAVERVAVLVPRRVVKLHLCHSMRAKDSNIRAALIDRFGGSKAAAIGLKKTPGPLYGVRSHEWSALALAVTWFDKHEGERDDDEKEDAGTDGRVKEGSGTEEGGEEGARAGTRQSASSKEADRNAAGNGKRRRRAQRPSTDVRRRT